MLHSWNLKQKIELTTELIPFNILSEDEIINSEVNKY